LEQTANTRIESADGAEGRGAESDADSEVGSADESDTEDEFVQFPESQEVNDGRADAEDATQWDGEMHVEEQEEGETIRRLGSGCRQHHNRTAGCRRAQSGVAEQFGSLAERQLHAGGPNQDTQRSQEQSPPIGIENETSDGRTKAEKRKAMTVIRHRQRDRKRRAEKTISLIGHDQRQRELQVIVGAGISSQEHRSMAPWEHRGILGHTRGGGRQDAAAAGGGQDGACRR
jgi:hypothetical protein